MSSDNPISDIVEGAAKGLLEWSAEKIVSFVQKLNDRKLAFIAERKTIEVVKEQYNSGEAKFYAQYIKDKELLFLVRLGLTLRKLQEDEEKLQNLRNKILNKYGIKGLHVSQFAQNGILNRYFGLLIEKMTAEDDLQRKIVKVLINIEKYSLFVSSTAKVAEVITKTSIIVTSHSPSIFVIAGLKSAAPIVFESISPLEKVMEDYELERSSSEEKEILFFKRKL